MFICFHVGAGRRLKTPVLKRKGAVIREERFWIFIASVGGNSAPSVKHSLGQWLSAPFGNFELCILTTLFILQSPFVSIPIHIMKLTAVQLHLIQSSRFHNHVQDNVKIGVVADSGKAKKINNRQSCEAL